METLNVLAVTLVLKAPPVVSSSFSMVRNGLLMLIIVLLPAGAATAKKTIGLKLEDETAVATTPRPIFVCEHRGVMSY